MRLRLLAPRYWLTWAGLGLLRLVALLPFAGIVRLGRLLGALLRRLALALRRARRGAISSCAFRSSPRRRASGCSMSTSRA